MKLSDNNNHSQSPNRNQNGHRSYNRSYRGEQYSGERFPKEKPQEDELDLTFLAGTLFRYKWWITVTVIATTLLSFVVVNMITPQYESSGTVLIMEEQSRMTGNGTGLSNMLTSTYGIGASTRINNEIGTLQSRQLSDAIAEKIMDHEVMENGQPFPILFVDYPGDTTRVGLLRLSDRIRNQMNVERYDRDTDILRITYRRASPVEAKELVNLTIDTYTELSSNQRRVAANSAINFLEQEKSQIEQQLQGSEEALREYMSRTNLVQIDGQTSALINRMAELESQLQQVQVQRVAISSSIDSYENQLERIRPGLAEQLSENVSGQIERAQFRLAELQVERTLFIQGNPALRENPELEPQFVQLENEINSIREEIRSLTNNLLSADDSDVYIGFLDQEDGGVTSRIVELRRNIIEKRIEESQLNAQEDALQQRLSNENMFFDTLPDNMMELARLQRDAQINEELYKTISQQFQETQLWEQTQYGSGRVMDYAIIPLYPASPNKFLFLLVGFILGGILSAGGVIAKETFNQSIDGTTQLKAIGYPLLAVIPNIKKTVKKSYSGKEFVNVKEKDISTSWTVLLDNLSPLSESYRRVYNNIVFSDPDIHYKTILITSPKQGEGKSTVAINLAVTLAEAGNRVLMIDADLRRPKIHTYTGEKLNNGVSELFFDKITTKQAIKKSVAPGLHIMTAGRKVSNPVAIIQSRKFASILREFKPNYDHIVIDTPPYGVITDSAPLIQRVSDGVVIITKFGDTRENELNHTIENLEMIKANILGTVLTNYNHKESADYYYYSRYTYDSYQAYEKYEKAEG